MLGFGVIIWVLAIGLSTALIILVVKYNQYRQMETIISGEIKLHLKQNINSIFVYSNFYDFLSGSVRWIVWTKIPETLVLENTGLLNIAPRQLQVDGAAIFRYLTGERGVRKLNVHHTAVGTLGRVYYLPKDLEETTGEKK